MHVEYIYEYFEGSERDSLQNLTRAHFDIAGHNLGYVPHRYTLLVVNIIQ